MRYTEEDNFNYRIQSAWKAFEDAKILADNSSWNSSMNRLYYACFYIVLALLSKYKINSHTHSGTKTQFSQHFVKTGKLKKEFGILYGDLFDLRQKGDYGEFVDFNEKQIIPMIPSVEEFLRQIELLIEE
jgi:uncharacterized protein (UPF0332 family)